MDDVIFTRLRIDDDRVQGVPVRRAVVMLAQHTFDVFAINVCHPLRRKQPALAEAHA